MENEADFDLVAPVAKQGAPVHVVGKKPAAAEQTAAEPAGIGQNPAAAVAVNEGAKEKRGNEEIMGRHGQHDVDATKGK